MRKSIAVAAAAALIGLTASTANAAVNYDPAEGGFAGKGDVQLALGYNNKQLQDNASKLTFTASQLLSESATQALTQSGSQSATQSATQKVSCTVNQKNNTFTRDGDRAGTRTATRTGEREGERSGVRTAAIGYSVAYDTRDKKQITGFNLQPAIGTESPWSKVEWNDATFGDWTYSGTEEFGDVAWGAWDEDPGVCFSNNPGLDEESVVDITTYGTPVGDSEFQEGDINYGTITYGTVVTGPAVVSVNGVTMP